MLYLDYYSYHNRLRNVSIMEKLLIGAGGLMLSLFLSNPLALVLIVVLMHLVIIYAQIPIKYLARLWVAPLTFLLLSLVTIVVSISPSEFTALVAGKIGVYTIGITAEGLSMAAHLALRSITAVACLFMIATTTPVAHVVAYLSQFSPLKTVMEITLLTYRFIFVILSTAANIYTAQQSRLGYSTIKRSLYSISFLAGNLGRKSFFAARDVYTALLARNYHDQLVFRYPSQPVEWRRILAITAGYLLVIFTSTL
jgi:cobalt/nickel transport system permease protein